jgi:hypothetical protein
MNGVSNEILGRELDEIWMAATEPDLAIERDSLGVEKASERHEAGGIRVLRATTWFNRA